MVLHDNKAKEKEGKSTMEALKTDARQHSREDLDRRWNAGSILREMRVS